MTRTFSGIKPTGHMTLGNYLGAVKHWVETGQSQQDQALYCVVDLHALTVDHDPARVRRLSRQAATLLLAAGLDPEVCTLFVQSHVAEHTRLAFLMECTATDGDAAATRPARRSIPVAISSGDAKLNASRAVFSAPPKSVPLTKTTPASLAFAASKSTSVPSGSSTHMK